MKYGLNYSELKVIEKALKSHPEVEEAVLFGSRVIGSFKEASDVDIALKGKKANTNLALRLKSYFEEETNLPYFFDFLSYSHISNKNLKNQIDKDGVVIYRKGWQKIKLGDAVQLLKEAWKVGDKIFPYIGLEHIEENSLRLNSHGDSNSITSNKYRFYSGNTLFGKLRPYFRKVVKPKFDGICSTDIWVITPKEGYNEDFIFYFFANQKLVDLANSSSKGTRMPRADWNFISETIWDFPPLPKQKAIAEVLSSLDDKIELLHNQNKTLENIAQTLFHKWFIQDAKDDWEKGFIPDEFNFTMGLSPPGNSYNKVNEGLPMFQGNADFGFRFPQNRIYTTEPKRIAEPFNTLISVRAPVGEQNMALEKCCIGRGVSVFKYKSNELFYTYTYYKMKSLINKIKEFNQMGTVFGSINKQNFNRFPINIPPLNIVKNFQNIAKPIDDKIILNCIQVHKLENLRDTLLPKLINGKMKVKSYE